MMTRPFRAIAARREEQRRRNKEIGEEIVRGLGTRRPFWTIPEMEKRLLWVRASGAVVDLETGRMWKKELAPIAFAASVYTLKEEKNDD